MIKRSAAGGEGETVVHKVKFWNKVQALELLMKHHGLLQAEQGAPEAEVPCFILPEGTKVAIE